MVACVHRNSAGQLYLLGADGKPFDISKYVGGVFYILEDE